MSTISWVVGSAAPVQLDLRQDDGTASAVMAVEVGINVNGVCQRIAATADGDAWAFTPVGIPVGYHRAQIWWDAGRGFETLAGAAVGLRIMEAC